MKFFSPQVITVKKIRIILGSKTNLNIQKRTNIRYIAAYPRQTIQWQHMRLYFVEILEISFFFFLTKDCHGSTATVEVTQTFILLSSLVPPPHIGSTWGCIFLQLSRQFKQSAYLFRECLAAPLVHVLGNTIWPQVPFVYLKPSVSARLLPVLIVSRVSSHFTSTLII